jgi:hypothetical protein
MIPTIVGNKQADSILCNGRNGSAIGEKELKLTLECVKYYLKKLSLLESGDFPNNFSSILKSRMIHSKACPEANCHGQS